jgi:CelD/BcsL family acetyltransferase involved in cellulose biosynthesis
MFLNSLNRELRKSIRKNSRRLTENFAVDFADTSKGTQTAEAMKIFFDLHQKRWTTKGLPGAFIDQRTTDFHLDIAERFSRKGWLGLFQLRLSGLPAAARYGFKYKSKYYAYLSGFDPRFSEFGVGNLLISFVVAECINKNISEFDFMRGAEEYKKHWNTFTRWNHQALLVRPGIVGNIKYRFSDQYRRVGSRLIHF